VTGGLGLVSVRCPRCGGRVLVSVEPRVVEEARASPAGLAAVAVPHGDHALLVYFDADGRERGVRAVVLAPPLEDHRGSVRPAPREPPATPRAAALERTIVEGGDSRGGEPLDGRAPDLPAVPDPRGGPEPADWRAASLQYFLDRLKFTQLIR